LSVHHLNLEILARRILGGRWPLLKSHYQAGANENHQNCPQHNPWMAFLYCVHFSTNLFTFTPQPENTSANRNYTTKASQVVYNAWNDHCQEAASVLLEISGNRQN